MTSPIPTERLEELIVLGEKATDGRVSTHWANCWSVHPRCAEAFVAELAAELLAAREALVSAENKAVAVVLNEALDPRDLTPSGIINRDRRIANKIRTALLPQPEQVKEECRAAQDGECIWDRCPQTRDGEPAATGRRCPLPWTRWGGR